MKKILNLLFCCISLLANAQNFEFVENKGQWNSAVKYQGQLFNGAFYLEAQGYKVLQQNEQDLAAVNEYLHSSHSDKQKGNGNDLRDIKITNPQNKLTVRSHAYEVLFDQSNTNPLILPEKPQLGYNNYYVGATAADWVSNCKIYAATTYKNMYPGIDVRYYSDNGHLKYDIIIHPKADISKLALNYIGVDGLALNNGNLVIKTSVASVEEKYPYSYQLVNGVRKQVKCQFKIYGNKVKYELGNYDRNQTLVIDPSLIFSTFTGSTIDNWGYTATYGPDGSMYGGGVAFGSGFPTTNGAFQVSFGGGQDTGEKPSGYDISIIKLSADGSTRIYATYVGGSGNEAPHSMVADRQGNLIVAGRTTSNNFPRTKPMIGQGSTTESDWDIVVFKLNAAGTAMVGSLQIGGSDNDGVNIKNKYPSPQPSSLMQNYGDDSRSEVIVDGSGSILLASCTKFRLLPMLFSQHLLASKMGCI
jgi:hypothetical protein